MIIQIKYFQGDKAYKMVPHSVCKKNEAANLVAKAFYDLKEKICYGYFSSVGEEYLKTVEELKEAGVESSAIPKFSSVKSRLYTAKGMRGRAC